MMLITSASNEHIKDIKKLIKSSKERHEKGIFVVEGIRMFKEIPVDRLVDIYVSETGLEKYGKDISAYSIEPNIVSDKVFNSLSDTNTPQGILALVKMQKYTLQDICENKSGKTPFLLIMERLQDPGNMGTIIRTSEGAGVTGIIISSDSVDIYNPKTIRSTMGSVFRMPIYVSSDLKNDITVVKDSDITIYAAHLNGNDFYTNSYCQGVGFLIGNEGNGLSEEISSTADKLIRIPMCGKVESLNAATSAAIISYEVLRQRIKK